MSAGNAPLTRLVSTDNESAVYTATKPYWLPLEVLAPSRQVVDENTVAMRYIVSENLPFASIIISPRVPSHISRLGTLFSKPPVIRWGSASKQHTLALPNPSSAILFAPALVYLSKLPLLRATMPALTSDS